MKFEQITIPSYENPHLIKYEGVLLTRHQELEAHTSFFTSLKRACDYWMILKGHNFGDSPIYTVVELQRRIYDSGKDLWWSFCMKIMSKSR